MNRVGYVVRVRFEVDIWRVPCVVFVKGRKGRGFYGLGIDQKEELREGEED